MNIINIVFSDISVPSPSHFKIREVNSKDVATQCHLIDRLPSNQSTNLSEQCRLCGGLFADDSKAVKDLWLGCDEPDCKYWLHVTCLLDKSPKNNREIRKESTFQL
jgi:hypothetical protein